MLYNDITMSLLQVQSGIQSCCVCIVIIIEAVLYITMSLLQVQSDVQPCSVCIIEAVLYNYYVPIAGSKWYSTLLCLYYRSCALQLL